MSRSNTLKWKRTHVAAQRATNAREAEETSAATLGVVIAAQHDHDVAWLEGLQRAREATDVDRRVLAESLAWLRGEPARDLSPAWRRRFESMAARHRMVREGKPLSPEKAEQCRVAALKRGALLNAKRAEDRTIRRPAWADDPSLLPRRPPGAKP